MPSRPILQATVSPSSHSRCSLKQMPGPAMASVDASVALRTWSGSRRSLSPSYGIRYRSYDGSVFRLRGPSRLFIVPTMYIPTAIITTPRKATQHKSAKQASGIASANKTSRCMSCPSPPRPNNDRTRSDVPQPEAIFLSRRKFNATPNVDAAACGLTLRHRREALRQGRAPASYPGERTVRLCYRVARNLPAGGIR